ncbi:MULTISPECIES: hypothetical protein [unclassified Bradyrhizobium]|uniref:hypothetical protein n=1 Tax=unclassified Bradyrhizobium TaxID=2631580 RepID=UPI00291665BC|nr:MULTISPECIES: hypothetical protein [unclassified Bradyrhizobium]
MMPGGIELFQLRQRRSATGDTYFTGRIGSALVIVVRDDVERDLWKAIACDPATSRDRPLARAISARADDHGWYEDDSMNDEIPDDLLGSPSQLEGC